MIIGILGGSFDPPHKGHLWVAKTLIKNGSCQKIILIPCFKHPFLKPLTNARHRLAMTKMLEAQNIEVSDIEVRRKKTSYAIDTLNALKKQLPKDKFVLIIGEDQIKDFKKWKGWREIIERFGLITVPRATRPPRGSPTVTPEVSSHFVTPLRWPTRPAKPWRSGDGLLGGGLHFTPIDISSSQIRKRIRGGKNIDDLVPEKVKKYIIRHKLYV